MGPAAVEVKSGRLLDNESVLTWLRERMNVEVRAGEWIAWRTQGDSIVACTDSFPTREEALAALPLEVQV